MIRRRIAALAQGGLGALVAIAFGLCTQAVGAEPGATREVSGTLADGALWRARVPAAWNGVLSGLRVQLL